MGQLNFPTPPRSLVWQGWIKRVAVLLLGISGVLGSFTGAIALIKIDDFQNESHCRSVLSNTASRLQGEIDTRGWKAVLDLRVKPDKAETERRARELNNLVSDWVKAQDRKDRADEICGG